MAIQRTSRSFSATRIARLAHKLLDASTLCAIATVSPGGQAHVNTGRIHPGFRDHLDL
jgi:adenylylsulfate kinase-like enzyme